MPKQQGLTVERTQELVDEFLSSYNGNIDVFPIIKENQEDIYGEQNSKEKYGFEIAGAYHPARRIITLVTANIRDEKDVKTTLRHELLGHYGLNTFKPSEKLALLSMVRDTQTLNEPSLKAVWDKVETLYPDKNSLEKAEEVFAFVAEEPQTFLSKAWDKVTAKFNQIMRDSGLVDSPLTKAELRIEANKVAEGIKNGERVQQTFPANDNEQFKRIDTVMKNEKKPFHVTVAEKIIEQLETGTAPWQKPWKAGNNESFLPYNPISGNRYKGINTLHLLAQGKEDRRWLTYNQAKKLGAQVKAGEKGTTVQYWKFSEERTKRDEATGKPILDNKGNIQKETVKLERPKVFYASVFNAEQINDMPPPPIVDKKEQEWEPLERAENLLKASGASISHSQSDRAFYRSSTDEIHMPSKELFDSADKYYATALHELGHWTGHETRLDRPLNNPFGSEAYAKEELRAEISSMILGEELQIGHDPEQHSAYVKSWIKVLKDDPLEIFRAAADAEKINTHVLSLEKNLVLEQANSQDNSIVDIAQLSKQAQDSIAELESAANRIGFDIKVKPAEYNGENSNKVEVHYERNSIEYPVMSEVSLIDNQVETSLFENVLEPVNGIPQSDILFLALLDAEKTRLVNQPLGQPVNISNNILEGANTLDSSLFQLRSIEAAIDFNGEDNKARHNPEVQKELLTSLGLVEDKVQSILLEQLIDAGTALRNETNSNDYNPLTSYLNLVKTAENLGFEAVLKPKDPNSEYENLQVQYKRGDTVYPVSTELLLGDGKALTSVNDERISGTSYTAETEWQSDALYNGLLSAEQDMLLNNPSHINNISLEVMNNKKDNLFSTLGSANFEMNAIEAAAHTIPLNEQTPMNDAFKLSTLSTGLDMFGNLIDDLSESTRNKIVLTDADIEKQFSQLLVNQWDKVKEESFLKGAIPSVTIDHETNLLRVDFQPSEKFSDLNCVLWDDKITTTFNKEVMETLEDGLNAALLHSIHKESEKTETSLSKGENVSKPEPITKHYLDVPYNKKDEAKELGAKWDKEAKSWYAPSNFPLEQFSEWDKNNGHVVQAKNSDEVTQEQAKTVNEKTFLAVPYSEKNQAKAAGAKWDKVAKSWYADSSSDMNKLQKFVSDKKIAQDPVLSPREEFTDTLKNMKAVISGDHPIMDGKKQRIECEGDKKGETSGFYVAHLDGHPAAYFMNNRTGQEIKWKSKGYSLSDEDKAVLNAESAKKTQERNKADKANHEKVSKDVTEFFIASPSPTENQYLTNKSISGEETKVASTETLKHLAEDSRIKVAKSFTEAKTLREADPDNIVFNEGDLLIPAKDKNNKIWSLQNIQPNGRKGFAKGGKKSDHYCVVGNNTLDKADVIIIGEGYATAKTVEKSTKSANAATVTSFDSGNLINVAKQLRKDHPDKPIIIAGEDDKKAELKPPYYKNVGKEKAIEAAKAVDGIASFPTFAQGEAENGLSDFNDLETKSSLGSIAVDRQLRAAINKAVEQKVKKQKLIQTQNKTQGIETPKRKVASR